MLTLRGSPALSNFRLQKLLQDLSTAGLQARAIGAEFVHAVELSAELTVAEPRPGKLSPWASKATDIAHICGLQKIKRIERVIVYTIDLGETIIPFPLTKLDATQLQILRARLHDRMTQVVFGDLDACQTL